MIVLKIIALIFLIPFCLQSIFAFFRYFHLPITTAIAAVCAIGSGWLIKLIFASF